MSVRLGISPIGWSNDDLPELGGDIPLDTCLAEAREAGFEGIELGHKFPRDPALLQSLLADHELRLGLRLVQRAPARAIGCRGTSGDRAASRLACSDGMRGSGLCRNQRRHRWRPNPAAIEPTEPTGWALARFRHPPHRACRPLSGARYPPGLSPPHGDGRRDRGRNRPFDGVDRRQRRSAARHRASGLCRRRPGRYRMAAWTAHQPCPLQGRPAGCAGTRSRGRSELSRRR